MKCADGPRTVRSALIRSFDRATSLHGQPCGEVRAQRAGQVSRPKSVGDRGQRKGLQQIIEQIVRIFDA